MRPHYSTISRPIPEAIDYAAAADHLRVDSAADITYIEALIAVACDYVGDVTGRVGTQTTLLCVAGSWASLTGNVYCDLIKLGRCPLVSVSSIKYYAPEGGALTTMDSADYRVITTTEPGILQPVDSWPDVDDRPDAIQITFVAGHSDGNPAPATWKHAAKMLVAHLYENRVPINIGNITTELPYSLNNLIEHNRIEGRFA
jgi:uncharacterized phiE125 gp8 family phage protein